MEIAVLATLRQLLGRQWSKSGGWHPPPRVYDQITPGGADYLDTVAEIKAAGIEVLFYGGYQREAALLIRQARGHDYDLQMIGGDVSAASRPQGGTRP
jgi:ABC-type branched-subunit amino acid transport system substrate-binding protein